MVLTAHGNPRLSPLHQTDSLSPLREAWVGIVDDDDSVRRALARFLRISGISVETFASAAEYLSYSGMPPSCLVIDVQLGASTGFDLRDRLAARDGGLPPIIFITACDDIAAFDPGQGRGVSAWLRKPLRAQALVDLVFQLSATSYSPDQRMPATAGKKEA
jgi:FixJ family two-component response regulator